MKAAYSVQLPTQPLAEYIPAATYSTQPPTQPLTAGIPLSIPPTFCVQWKEVQILQPAFWLLLLDKSDILRDEKRGLVDITTVLELHSNMRSCHGDKYVQGLTNPLQQQALKTLEWWESYSKMQPMLSNPMLRSARRYWMLMLAYNRSLSRGAFMWQWMQNDILVQDNETHKYKTVALNELCEAECLGRRPPKVPRSQADACRTWKVEANADVVGGYHIDPPSLDGDADEFLNLLKN